MPIIQNPRNNMLRTGGYLYNPSTMPSTGNDPNFYGQQSPSLAQSNLQLAPTAPPPTDPYADARGWLKEKLPYNPNISSFGRGEQKSALAENIQTLGNVGGGIQFSAGVIGGGIALAQALKSPIPMNVRPQQLSPIEYQDPSKAVIGNLNQQNNRILASGLNQLRSTGGAGTEKLVGAALENQLGIAQTESQMKTTAMNNQTEANARIAANNAQMTLDYQAYKDEYNAAMQRRKDALWSSVINTAFALPTAVAQSQSDMMSSLAGLYGG